MLQIPSVPTTEALCAEYRVTLNGLPAPVWLTRVSAQPVNRVFMGRTPEMMAHTEPAGFCMFTMDEPVQVVVEPLRRSIESVELRPSVFGVQPSVEDGKIVFTLDKPQYITLQLNGQHNALHLLPSAPKDYGVQPGAGVLYYGPGFHQIGTVELHSHETVYLDDGAVVYGSFFAMDAEDIRILGRGILDGSLMPRPGSAYQFDVPGGDLICLNRCQNVTIDGPVLRDANLWTVFTGMCDNVHISNLKIFGYRPNSDGVDFCNSRHCSIRNSFLRSFDDLIVVKGLKCFDDLALGSNGWDANTDDIVAEDCVLWCDWGHALEIGVETAGSEMKNITMRRCHVIKSSFSSIDVGCAFRADVHDILFEDCSVENDDHNLRPYFQSRETQAYGFPEDDGYVPEALTGHVFAWGGDTTGARGRLHNLTFRRITLLSKLQPECAIEGVDAAHLAYDVTFEGVTWNGAKLDTPEKLKLRTNEFTDNVTVRA